MSDMMDVNGSGRLLAFVSPLIVALASCAAAPSGEKANSAKAEGGFRTEVVAQFDEPWAMAFDQGTGIILVTEKKGTMRFRVPSGQIGQVSGLPKVDVGGQGGLGDVAFAPGQSGGTTLNGRVVYLTWAEAGTGDTRGAALGRGTLACNQPLACSLQNLQVIWRQAPKVTGRGHFSHRIAFSPDGKSLFLSSGDRQKFTPAQDLNTNLGKVLRLNLDGSPAAGNPFAAKGSPADQIWSYGHRNVLGLAFDPQGRLWDLEHGPAGGDEINLVKPGQNYGWPLVSDGDHYDGKPIPRHKTRPDLAAPAVSWNPVIAPGDFLFYTGDLFPRWKGQVLVGGMKPSVLVRVAIDGEKAREVSRTAVEHRIRDIGQGPDGAVWLLEDGTEEGASRLLRLVPDTAKAK
jgi:glucose/arabinose dehydrogenase